MTSKRQDPQGSKSSNGHSTKPLPPCLSAALQYAKRGQHVLPLHGIVNGVCTCGSTECSSPGKHPRTLHGLKEATSHHPTIVKWFNQWPNSNVGIATGQGSGFIALDIDPRNGGDDTLDALIAEHGSLPNTVEALTGGGGRHILFAYDKRITTSNGKVGPGIDIKSDGGYIVAPPSTHASERQYEWELSSHPDDVALAIAPAFLMRASPDTTTKSVIESPGIDPEEVLEGVAEGARDDTLFRYACRLRSEDRPKTEAVALILAAAGRCDPPFPAKAALQKVNQAYKYPPGHNSADSADSAEPEWKPPVPFHDFDSPPFPTNALSPWMASFVKAEAVATQTPPDLAGMLALAAVACAAARRYEVKVRGEWSEPLNIFVVVVLPSGSRKSAVFRDVTCPIAKEEQLAMGPMKEIIAAAEEDKKLLEDQLKRTRKEVAEGKADKSAAQELATQIASFAIPRFPRLLADDTTAERLEVLLAENGGRMGVFSPEGDIFDIMAGRYSQARTVNLGVFLKGHAGDDIRTDRIARGSVVVYHPAITMGLAVQPDVVEGLAANRSFRGRGLTPRFLYSSPDSNIGRRDVRPAAVPLLVRSEYEANLSQLISMQPETDGEEEERPRSLSLSGAALEDLLRFAESVELELGPAGNLASIAEWGSKLVGAVVRIAGLLHLADAPTELERLEVGVDVINRAIAIGEYLIPHAKAAFALMGSDPAVNDAQYVIRHITAKGLTEFTRRDLFNETRSRFKKVANMDPALDLLTDHGYIREREAVPRKGPGRKPSPTLDVNPSLDPQNPHNTQK